MSTTLGYLSIAASSAAIYLFMVIGFRLFGKKELAQLSVPDLIFVLLISNAVQNAMVGADSSLTGGLVAASTLFIINYAFKWLLYKSARLQKLIQGEPMILIYQGKINDANLRRARLTMNELLESIREHGTEDIAKVNLAILEVDGNISLMTDDFSKRTMHIQRIKRKKKNNTIFG